jgi:hypothetical protein
VTATTATIRRQPGVLVQPSATALRLAVAIAVLASAAAAVGVLWSGGAAPDDVPTVHGVHVELFGEGLYRYDLVFKGAGNRGSDVVTLAVAVPALLAARRFYRSASLAGTLAFLGVLGWFLYVYGSLALGSAYNEFFLGYVALASLALFTVALVVRSVDLSRLDEDTLRRLPSRPLALLVLVSAALTGFVWLEPVVSAVLAGRPPALLLHSTTLVTEALDLAVVAPAAVVAGNLLLRRRPEGLLIGVPLLVLLWVLAPAIVLQTLFQWAAGWPFTPAQVAGPIAGFVALGITATATLVPTLRTLHAPARAHAEFTTTQQRTQPLADTGRCDDPSPNGIDAATPSAVRGGGGSTGP